MPAGPGGARIAARVAKGYAVAGRAVGEDHALYRPDGPLDPLAPINWLGDTPAAFDARPSYNFAIPALHRDALRYALADRAALERGDYLVGPAGTLFVADLPALLPVPCVLCNATVALRRGRRPAGFGAIADRSDAPAVGEEEVARGWPCSMLYGGRGAGDAMPVPGDAPPPDFLVLMPAVPGLPPPAPGWVLAEEGGAGRRFSVDWSEVSALGWRLAARLLALA